MWLAQAQIALAGSLQDLELPTKWLHWALDRGLSTGVMAEQFHPFTGEGRSVAPLAWSHAEFLETYRRLVVKRQELTA
jgi:GH15 family glucan-1,4-alpha-glucosidase